MIEWMVAAPASGSGKTVVTCALLMALKSRGLMPCAFKCGPDYIDPMFHRSVLGVESHNLDLFLATAETVQTLYACYSAGHGAAVTEGVMGLYDGLGGTTATASAWHVADVLQLPVLLVVRPKGASLTLAAQVQGLRQFRQHSHIAGVFLNDCSPMLAKSLAPMLEKETGLPVLGYLSHMEEATIESRHLGLYTAGEIGGLVERIDAVAAQLAQTMDWKKFLALGKRPDKGAIQPVDSAPKAAIAVARDKAFCFTYAETLDALRHAGAELLFFSPLKDEKLPEGTCGLYLPGGYPELYARELSKNGSMLDAVKTALEAGMPTVAECGGFLYLGRTLRGNDGTAYSMVGALPGEAVRKDRLVRFGYAGLTAAEDSLLFQRGETIPAHEFHYWDSSENGDALTAVKPITGRRWKCGFANENLYAAFPHLYFAGRSQLAERFVQAAMRYQIKRELQ